MFALYARSGASARSSAGLVTTMSSTQNPPWSCLSSGQREDDVVTISDHSYSSVRLQCNNLLASFRAMVTNEYHALSQSKAILGSYSMSQPSAAFADLSAMDLESPSLVQPDQLFNTIETDEGVYHPNSSEATNSHDFMFSFESCPTPPDTTALSLVTTPSYSDYNFDQNSSSYPTPGPSTPHPYPIEQQKCFNPIVGDFLPILQQSQPLRSRSNISYLRPSHPSQGYTRRRSLSQRDADHIAAISAQVTTPSFVRLQVPRSRSVTPGEASRRRRAGQHSRSTSRSSNHTGHQSQENGPTSVPYYVNGRVPTHIGDPLPPTSPYYHHPATQQQWPVSDGYSRDHPGDQVVFRHMVGSEQMERSQKIIEIGAMAARARVDPAIQGNSETTFNKLEEVERYLKAECGQCDDALRGCVTIREVLMGKVSIATINSEAGNHRSSSDVTDALEPSTMIVAMQEIKDLFTNDGADDERVMERLIQDNTSPYSEIDL